MRDRCDYSRTREPEWRMHCESEWTTVRRARCAGTRYVRQWPTWGGAAGRLASCFRYTPHRTTPCDGRCASRASADPSSPVGGTRTAAARFMFYFPKPSLLVGTRTKILQWHPCRSSRTPPSRLRFTARCSPPTGSPSRRRLPTGRRWPASLDFAARCREGAGAVEMIWCARDRAHATTHTPPLWRTARRRRIST